MLNDDDLRQFMPSYLSQGSHNAFIDEIRRFTSHGTGPFYTTALSSQQMLFQGDGLDRATIMNLPDVSTKEVPSMVLSNTCDISPDNQRLFLSNVVYAPIVPFANYMAALRRRFKDIERINAHEKDVRKQQITQIFFLPKGERLQQDSIVFLDRVASAASSAFDRTQLPATRLFVLSDFGAWLLSLKLSIHFCRIRDKVDRSSGIFA